MSFLPGNLTPALLRSYRRKVISPFKRSFDFEIDICFTWIFLCVCVKTKKPITQSTINRREHRSRFKMMFYVIGFDIQRRVLLSNCSANRTNSVMSSPAFPVYRYLVGQFRFISSLCEHISIQLCMWNKFPHYHYTRTDTLCQFWEQKIYKSKCKLQRSRWKKVSKYSIL